MRPYSVLTASVLCFQVEGEELESGEVREECSSASAMYSEASGVRGTGDEAVLPADLPPFSHSRSTLTLSLDSKTRHRRYRHKRSHSQENYLRILTPRNSPHLEHVIAHCTLHTYKYEKSIAIVPKMLPIPSLDLGYLSSEFNIQSRD
jgi:hypothetical protein